MKKNARPKIEQQPLIDRIFKVARPVGDLITTYAWWQVHTMQRQLAAQVRDDEQEH